MRKRKRKDMTKKNVMKEDTMYLTKEFEEKFTYEGNDLGSCYSKESTKFRVYAPTADKVTLNLYKDGLKGEAFQQKEMEKAEKSGEKSVSFWGI